MKRLQNLQTHAAKIVTGNYPKHQHNILKDLHWLPVRHRIDYKISLITFKALNTNNPKYLKELIKPQIPQKSLRSSSQFLLEVPASRSALHDRAYSVVGPKTINSLPINLRKMAFVSEPGSCLIGSFKKQLKPTCSPNTYPAKALFLQAPLQSSCLLLVHSCELWRCLEVQIY